MSNFMCLFQLQLLLYFIDFIIFGIGGYLKIDINWKNRNEKVDFFTKCHENFRFVSLCATAICRLFLNSIYVHTLYVC